MKRNFVVFNRPRCIASRGNGRVEPEQFFNCGGPERRIGSDSLLVFWVRSEVPDRGTDDGPGGIYSGHQLQGAHSNNHLFGNCLSADFCMSQLRDEVILRIVLDLGSKEVSNERPVLSPFGAFKSEVQDHFHPFNELMCGVLIDAEHVSNDFGSYLF